MARKILNEASRNELLAITRKELDLRSKKSREANPAGPFSNRLERSAGYKGFSISDIDTSNVLTNNSLVVHLQVGDYDDVVELEDILYWVQISAENTNSYTPNQINTKVVTQAMMNSIDGMDIKLDCTCKDWQYRFAYQATLLGYKYGEKEGRPNEDARANPDNRGGVCKHLTAVLSNKRWLQQVTSTFMNWLETNIDGVNKYLGLKGDKVLTLPNELARQNAKLSWQKRRETNIDDNTDIETPENNKENQENITNNVQGNNPSTNAYNNIDNQNIDTKNDENNNE